MKSLIKYLILATVMLGTISVSELSAKGKNSYELPEKVVRKIESKVEETTKVITREIGLSEKQTKKVYAVKLAEAKGIETARADKAKSQHEIKNTILLINDTANKKVLKVLKKEQKILWNARKDKFAYNPGFLENLKDLYHQTKENVQEKLGLD